MQNKSKALELEKAHLLLGIKPFLDGPSLYMCARNEIVLHLAKNLERLQQFSKTGNFTLSAFIEANLVPGKLKSKLGNLPARRAFGPSDPGRVSRLLHTQIGELQNDDIERLLCYEMIWKGTVTRVQILKELYQKTNGFQTATNCKLHEAIHPEQREEFILKLSELLRSDPEECSRLLMQFPVNGAVKSPQPE